MHVGVCVHVYVHAYMCVCVSYTTKDWLRLRIYSFPLLFLQQTLKSEVLVNVF